MGMVATARWEEELWSYVCTGDGLSCPDYACCPIRLGGSWCANDHIEELEGILSGEPFESSQCGFVKPGEWGRVFRLVEMLAEQCLVLGKAGVPPVANGIINRVIQDKPVEIYEVPLVTCHGAVWRLSDAWVVFLNLRESERVRRITLFHEVFQMLAHSKGKRMPAFRRIGVRRGDFNELVADCFAIGFLMPSAWVREWWSKLCSLQKMAEAFNVPEAAMYLKLRRMSLV